MGITGENFDPEVKNQVEQRQKYYAKTFKDTTTLQTQNANSWLRLASSVDINAIRGQYNSNAEYDLANDRATELINQLGVNFGSELARLFVLTGGTAYYDDTTQALYSNRGIGTQAKGIYQTAYGFEGTEFGYRPMPAIESADIQFYNDGALAKADINIICNSPRQLDALEILYLRPGYTILLEWGHTNFVNNNGASENVDATGYITEPFTQFFQSNNTVDWDTIQEALERERIKKSYNYDGFHGVITNFSWTLNKDATYKVTIKAVTTGAVIESLKLNSNFNVPIPPPAVSGSSSPPTGSLATPSLSEKLSARTKEGDLFLAFSNIVGSLQSAIPTDLLNTANPTSVFVGLNLGGLIADHPPGVTLSTGDYFEPPYGSAIAWKYSSGGTSDMYSQMYYITFDALLAYLQSNAILYAETGKPYIRFEVGLKDSIPILSVPGRFSSDPRVCIINFDKVVDTNSSKYEKLSYIKVVDATTVTPFEFADQMNDTSKNQIEFNKRRTTAVNNLGLGGGTSTILFPTGSDVASNFQKDHLRGYLGSVHVNIEHIVSVFDKCAEDEGTDKLINVLQKLVNDISDALGGINDIKVKFNEKTRTVRIYDQALRSKEPTKTIFRSYGVKGNNESTIIKDISLTTQLSNEMSSMIAIGAQARANILSENATAFSKFNAGLVNRVEQVKVNTPFTSAKTPYQKFLEVTTSIIQYIEAIYPIGNPCKGFNLNEGNIRTLNKLNKDYCRYLVGHYSTVEIEIETPFIIPFKLSMTIPGMSGGTIYQKFGMDDLLLPYSYKGKVDYLIVNVEHSIQKNIWDTKYTAYTIPVPQTGSVTGLSVTSLPTVTFTPGSTVNGATQPIQYTSDPDPSYRAASIYDNWPWYILGTPNQGTHTGRWYNSNAYDLAPRQPVTAPFAQNYLAPLVSTLPTVNVYSPKDLTVIRTVNYGSAIQQVGPLRLYGQGLLAKDSTGVQIYIGHLGAINQKIVPGATIAKGEFIGTVGPTNGQVSEHLHIAVESGDVFNNWIQKDSDYNQTVGNYVLKQIRGQSYKGTFYP